MFDISNGCNTCEPFAATVPDNQYVNMDSFRETPTNNNNLTGINENNNVNNNYNERIRNGGNNNTVSNNNNVVNNNNNNRNNTVPNNNNQINNNNRNNTGNNNTVNNNVGNNNTGNNNTGNNNTGNNNTGNNNTGNNGNGEPFQNTGPTLEQRKEMKKYVVIGLVIVAALAWNEGVKFMIEQQLKFNEGNNMYYLGYAVVATLLAIVIYKMTK